MTLSESQTELDRYLDRIQHLPPSPTLMIELTNLLKRPDRDIDELIQLMSQDPSLTAEILKRCNSAFFAAEEPATDVFEATFRLGFYEVYKVATALSGAQLMGSLANGNVAVLEALWRHSACSAAVANLIAQRVEQNEAVAFTAGLLHDVGKAVLAQASPNLGKGAGVWNLTTSDEAERKTFGFTHSELGGRLLARWQLPESIVLPVQFHHAPEQAEPFHELAAILNLADRLTYCLSEDDVKASDDAVLNYSASLLKLGSDDLSAIVAHAKESTRQLADLFGPPNSRIPSAA
jgi:putative nucleotidyltransferase with HDIG domain